MDRFQASNIANMQGLVTLITGGGSGMSVNHQLSNDVTQLCRSGLMVAKGFAANGATVYITGRTLELLEDAAVEAKSLGMTLIPCVYLPRRCIITDPFLQTEDGCERQSIHFKRCQSDRRI